jgi:DMSO/TMAO reductase YedYZ molybdopterin-dependent catalytic subunit
MFGLGALGVWGGRRAQDVLARALEPLTDHDPTGLTSLIPVGGGFRYYSIAGGVQNKDAADYRLDVGGLVDHPISYSFADLQAMPQVQFTKDFQCVTGWRVRSVAWSGVRLSEILDRARVQPGGVALRFHSFDGLYTESLTLDQARRPDVIVALQMLGKPVTHDHGGPVRLYVAPMYGYKSAKWLDGIDVVDKVIPGYWENYGYDVDGWVGRSNGRDDERTS